MICSSDGFRIESFNWGLGEKTNSHTKILGLLKSCQIARGKGIKEIQVFGDSKILIKILNAKDVFNNLFLNKTLQRLRLVLQDFSFSHFFHIMCGSNKEVDTETNLGCLLLQGALRKKEEEPNWAPIP